MVLLVILIILSIILVIGILWSKHNIQRDAIQKAFEDEQIDKLLKLM
jgi:hypothetical protein